MLQDKEVFKEKIKEKFIELYGKNIEAGTRREKYTVLATLVRNEISRAWDASVQNCSAQKRKKIYYLSIEFLPGCFLLNNLLNLGIKDMVEKGLAEMGLDLYDLAEQEEDPGLGNGGLGRLASGFLDSLASLGFQGYGCGIRYKYGLFEQKIINGEQVEIPDDWLKDGNIWEYRKPEEAEQVRYGGFVIISGKEGSLSFEHRDYETVRAVPYDIPIVGYQNGMVNYMRLWSAETAQVDFDFHTFCRGNYTGALKHKCFVEAVSQVLYPDDTTYEGQLLRLKQEYFFVSASLQGIIRKYKEEYKDLNFLSEQVAVHINDTHPAVAVGELMRILLDDNGMSWDEAWKITKNTISYTNHTTLPEALEKWPMDFFRELLPRVYMIIEEINERFCREVIGKYPYGTEQLKEMAIIWDGFIRMGNLAVIGSHTVNGVAKLHTQILKQSVMKSFHEYYPGKFTNKTNGITHRRWLLLANPRLSSLIIEAIGREWITRPTQLIQLKDYADDASFQAEIASIKLENKKNLAAYLKKSQGVIVEPESIFDIHIKRIHGYKRQLLNILHVMSIYNRLRECPTAEFFPRTFFFGGKAAPAYYLAKQVIKLINSVAEVVNNDAGTNDKLKVVFLENYNVSLAEKAYPAADVSEQISTAGKEASGTGNMKFMMNGAITIGTRDGANIEIREKVGEGNIFVFGATAKETDDFCRYGGYCPLTICNRNERIKTVCEQLLRGFFGQNKEFKAIYEHLLFHNDTFFVLHDFNDYAAVQERLGKKYREQSAWRRMCIHNIAHAGDFSSDRTISKYAEEIWKIRPVDESEIGE